MMNAAVANVIVSILLGKRYDYEDPTFKKLLSLVNINVRIFGSTSVSVCLNIALQRHDYTPQQHTSPTLIIARHL